MQITQVITFLAVAIAGAVAAPGGPPPITLRTWCRLSLLFPFLFFGIFD
jgi:hypothetical protein